MIAAEFVEAANQYWCGERAEGARHFPRLSPEATAWLIYISLHHLVDPEHRMQLAVFAVQEPGESDVSHIYTIESVDGPDGPIYDKFPIDEIDFNEEGLVIPPRLLHPQLTVPDQPYRIAGLVEASLLQAQFDLASTH